LSAIFCFIFPEALIDLHSEGAQGKVGRGSGNEFHDIFDTLGKGFVEMGLEGGIVPSGIVAVFFEADNIGVEVSAIAHFESIEVGFGLDLCVNNAEPLSKLCGKVNPLVKSVVVGFVLQESGVVVQGGLFKIGGGKSDFRTFGRIGDGLSVKMRQTFGDKWLPLVSVFSREGVGLSDLDLGFPS
jgi:hypothetical protein